MAKQTPEEKRKQELIDELIRDYDGPESFWGESGLFADLKRRIVERSLDAEMDDHLGYSKHDPKGNNSGNSRNGRGKKTVILGDDEVELTPPRDRNGSYQPQLIPKGKKYFKGFDDRIIAMYARGMSVRDIQACLLEMYQVDVSEGLISQATNGIMEEVKAWQNRPLDAIYPIVFLDCIVVKCRQDGKVSNVSVYLALGVNMDGHKELLGIWMSKTEGAKFWLGVITELKNRGVKDILIACVDGLKGFPEAIEAVFPQTEIQLCIVHMVRNSVRFVNWKDRKELCSDLKTIYTAATEEMAETALEEFGQKWDDKYPMISKSWRSHWQNIIPFFDYPADIRKAIYTTNAIESLNRSLRKVIKTKGAFPTEASVMKIFYLALENISKKWTMPIRCWNSAMNQFAIKFADRMPL
ncbi:MAG: IS256 family transposase [Gammaproteobacteria bacterium]